MSAVIYTGMETGTVGSLVLGGLLCSYFDWSVMFYVFGGGGIIFFAAWMFFVSDCPQNHPTISDDELLYIESQQSHIGESIVTRVLWMRLLRSKPVWAIAVSTFSHNWVYLLASIDIPGYFKNVLNMNISENGFTSGLPFVFAFVTQIMGSYLAEFTINKGYSMTNTRKFLTAVGFLPTIVGLCLVGFIGCNDFYLSVGTIIFLVGMANFSFAGYGVNVLDLSPRYAGIINSLVSCCQPGWCTYSLGYWIRHERSPDKIQLSNCVPDCCCCFIVGSFVLFFLC